MTEDASGPESWIEIPTTEQIRTASAGGGPYDFGFIPAMGRLLMTHRRIGPAFRALFGEIMFQPGHLDRRERELVAAVSSAAQDCFY